MQRDIFKKFEAEKNASEVSFKITCSDDVSYEETIVLASGIPVDIVERTIFILQSAIDILKSGEGFKVSQESHKAVYGKEVG